MTDSTSHLAKLIEYKQDLTRFLKAFLLEKQQQFQPHHPLTDDVITRLSDFATKGKMLRGAFVVHSYRLSTPASDSSLDQARSLPESVLKVAIAIELAQSALLIHDDILDQDQLRRGAPSMHAQYQHWAQHKKLPNTDHVGTGMAICVGDVALFLAFELLSQADQELKTNGRLSQLFTQEHIAVGLAEMQDFILGLESEVPSFEEVMRVYLYKTARYSVTAPILLGAFAAQIEGSAIESVEKVSEILGIIFQIKDDEMGLFGDSAKTGKAVGADIREGKKTPYYLALLEKSDQPTQAKLKAIFGNPHLSDDDITWVKTQLETSGARAHVNKYLQAQADQAKALIEAPTFPQNYRAFLTQLLQYLLQRTS